MTKFKLAQWKRMLRETDASQIVDFAVILPILLMVILGTLSFARAYNVYTTVTYAAQEGARVAAASSCATCGNNAATAADVANRVSEILRASAIDPGQIQDYAGASTPNSCSSGPATCGTQSNIRVCTNVQLNATTQRRRRRTVTTVTGPAACGSTVTFAYPYQFNLPFTSVSRQLVTLKTDVQMQSED